MIALRPGFIACYKLIMREKIMNPCDWPEIVEITVKLMEGYVIPRIEVNLK